MRPSSELSCSWLEKCGTFFIDAVVQPVQFSVAIYIRWRNLLGSMLEILWRCVLSAILTERGHIGSSRLSALGQD